MAIAIGIDRVSREFAAAKALDEVSLEIQAGEFFTLLGPSGSGKSTLLKLIGGLDMPTCGRIMFDGVDVTGAPANRRPVNTVFQDLALFPHMNVAQNVGYGLKVKGLAPAAIGRRVADALALVDLAGFENRNVNRLSGGQRQRVALARALIMEPGILLLDEPLTGLDERLRQQMRDEFGRLHKRTGATFILVTHNQDEALTLSGRMAIMNLGRIEQIGRPAEFFEAPADAFVARFIGMDTILRPERVEQEGPATVAWVAGQRLRIDRVVGGGRAEVLALRQDRIRLGPGVPAIDLVLREVQYRGLRYDLRLAFGDGQEIVASIDDSQARPAVGATVRVCFDAGGIVLVPERLPDKDRRGSSRQIRVEEER